MDSLLIGIAFGRREREEKGSKWEIFRRRCRRKRKLLEQRRKFREGIFALA